MGDYLDTYTSEYPDSGGAVESGYSLGSVGSSNVKGPVDDASAEVLASFSGPRITLWEKTVLSLQQSVFVKNGSTWTEVGRIPTSYDRLVGGGYQNTVTGTELDELEAAGLITTAEKNAILGGMT